MYEKNSKAVQYSLGTYHFLRNRVDSANGLFLLSLNRSFESDTLQIAGRRS